MGATDEFLQRISPVGTLYALESVGLLPWSLPDSGEALPLAQGDYETAAAQLGVEAAAVRAVAYVEARRTGAFDARKRPVILFEVHQFRALTNGSYDKSHPHLSAPYHSKERKASYRRDQWQVIGEAFSLAPEAAVKAASWGLFQVLGSNAWMAGWTDMQRFVRDMFFSAGQHLRLFLGYCQVTKVAHHLRTHNWGAFASGYNGKDYKQNSYDTMIAIAYDRFSRGLEPLAPRGHGSRHHHRHRLHGHQ